jgi:hypothetical protein
MYSAVVFGILVIASSYSELKAQIATITAEHMGYAH